MPRRAKKKTGLSTRQSSAVAKIAKKVVYKQAENKYFDTLTGVSYTDVGIMIDLSLVPQGDTDITRDGDQLYATSLQIRGYLTVADNTNVARVIVFRWKCDSVPLNDNILDTTYKGSVNYVNSGYHHDGRSDFVVLSDKTYNMQLGTNRSQMRYYLNKKLNHKINYNAGTTAGRNKIYMFVISDSAAIAHPTINTITRLNFRDF